MPHNAKQIRPAYILKYNYLAVKSVSALLRGITSNYDGDFYCLNCFHSYTTMKKLKRHGKICRNHDFCHMIMPKENNKMLKYNRGEKSLKVSFIVYANLECILQKISAYQVIPAKCYTEKKAEHKSSGYSQVKYCLFDKWKTECNYYR